MRERQRQEAGEGSQQVQVAGNLIIQHGIDEARAVEIARYVAKQELEQFSAEANALGSQRMDEFSEKLVDKFAATDQLEAFADPAFQVLLRKAQVGAASTDRPSDLDLLVGLLDDRVKRGADRHVRAGLDQAVQIVDHVDSQALLALTAFQAAQQFSPASGYVDQGLDAMERLFAQILTEPLPGGMPWLEHLDVLGAVRVMHLGLGTMKPFDNFYLEGHLGGYLAPGLEIGSDEEEAAAAALASVKVNLDAVEHEFRPGYRRLVTPTKATFEQKVRGVAFQVEGAADVVLKVATEHFKLGEIAQDLKAPLLERISERPCLLALRTWWDAIPTGAQVTAVGRVLATANAKRLDVHGVLPDLD